MRINVDVSEETNKKLVDIAKRYRRSRKKQIELILEEYSG